MTPWLIATWLAVVVLGLRRAHARLSRFYNLTEIHIAQQTGDWEQAAGYFTCLLWTATDPLGIRASSARQPLQFKLPAVFAGQLSQCRRQKPDTIRP